MICNWCALEAATEGNEVKDVTEATAATGATAATAAREQQQNRSENVNAQDPYINHKQQWSSYHI
jgi:hypothetical protein